MNCFKCNGSYQKKHGALEFNDDYVGIINIDNVDYFECSNCHDQLLPAETAKLIGNKRKELLEQYLQAQPIKDFSSAAETAESLKISRQALHKHKRINNGFIYQTIFNGNKVYLKKSIDLYNKIGDGRFLIKSLSTNLATTWISSNVWTKINFVPAASIEASAVIIASASPATIMQMNRATYYPNHLTMISANKESNENMLIDPYKPKEELDINNSNSPFYYEPNQTADI